MEERKYRITCANHPDTDAVEKCLDCRKFFCRECVIEINGKYHCRQCQEILANISETIGFAEKYDLRKLRFALGGCLVLVFAGIAGIIVLLVMPFARLGPAVMRCNGNLRQVYKAMNVYAGDHAGLFPPEDNDLTPIYGPKYSRGISLFNALKCPGTKNIVNSPAHLHDDSRSTTGPGMSYFFRGGLRLVEKEKDRGPLIWDQSPKNHKRKGVNVLHTDGSVDLYDENYPELDPER